MSSFHREKSQKYRFDPDFEAALMIAPIVLFLAILGLFLDRDYVFIPYLLRFIFLLLAGYLGASRLHNRWSNSPRRNIYNQMVPVGMRAGLFAAGMAWVITLLFILVAYFAEMSLKTGGWAGLLSALLDVGAGLLFGALGGWIYSKMNRPRILR